MLIDFTIKNYRSIKEPVTLSAIAHMHKRNKQDNEIAKPYFSKERNLHILPVLGIFGANSSGKSNVINALYELMSYLFFGAGEKVSHKNLQFINPFKLNLETSKLPTEFTLRVLLKENIYIYHLSALQNLVLQERLEYIPKSSQRAATRLLFERNWNKKSKKYTVENGRDFGNAYKEIQLSLKESQAFLGFLHRNLKNELLEPLTDWIFNFWSSVSLNRDYFDFNLACYYTTTRNKNFLYKTTEILKKFDISIENIEIIDLTEDNSTKNDYEVWITHKTNKGTTKWLLNEESLGTQKLFLLAMRLLHSFEYGSLMLVDELGSNTHPNINRELVKLFQNHKLNKKGAQLIFTSHDISLLRKNILRRDQIWFTQKREDQSTELYSLSDFRPRNDLIIDRAYLDGRFEGVPFLVSEEELTELVGVD